MRREWGPPQALHWVPGKCARGFTKIQRPAVQTEGRTYAGGCHNYDPFLDTLNIRCHIIRGSQKGTIILTIAHMCPRHLGPKALLVPPTCAECWLGFVGLVSVPELRYGS